MSRQAVSKWELGEATPEVEKLLALAKAFGVTTDELLRECEPGQQADCAPETGPQQPASPLERYFWRYRWASTAAVGLGSMIVGGFMLVSNGQIRQTLPASYPGEEFAFLYILSVILMLVGVVGVIRAVQLYCQGRKNS